MCLSTIKRSTTSAGVESRPRLWGRRFNKTWCTMFTISRIVEQAVGVAHPVFPPAFHGQSQQGLREQFRILLRLTVTNLNHAAWGSPSGRHVAGQRQEAEASARLVPVDRWRAASVGAAGPHRRAPAANGGTARTGGGRGRADPRPASACAFGRPRSRKAPWPAERACARWAWI